MISFSFVSTSFKVFVPLFKQLRSSPIEARCLPVQRGPTEGNEIISLNYESWSLRQIARPWLQRSICCPSLLWPSFKKYFIVATRKPRKKNCSDYNQTNKQDNKETNKKQHYSRLLRLLHILHPLGIKVSHQCKYREQSSI